MIPREILKKIRQIKLRTNLLVNGSARRFVRRIPTGFRPKAQGCEVRATLGHRPARHPNRNVVAAIPVATISHQHRQNPVGVSRGVRSFTQGSSATLGWRPESRWDSLNLPALSAGACSPDCAAGSSTGGAPAGSPRREPWVSASKDSPTPSGATDFLSRCSFAPAGADAVCSFTHGSRRGLPSVDAPQLPEWDSRPPNSAFRIPHSALP
jgi:hypothetical protein